MRRPVAAFLSHPVWSGIAGLMAVAGIGLGIATGPWGGGGRGPATAVDSRGTGGAAAGYRACRTGHICFYERSDGRGRVCAYDATAVDAISSCAFMLEGKVVRSVANRSRFRVHYYIDLNCRTRIGSTRPEDQGNLSGKYLVASVLFGVDATWSPSPRAYGCLP